VVRHNQPPGSTAGAITSLIIGAAAFVVGLVLIGAVMALKKLFVGCYRRWVVSGKLEKVAVGDGNAAASVAVTPVAILQNPSHLPLLAEENDVVRPAELKRVDLKGAFLSIRYYEAERLAKAKLTISSKVVQKRVGSPVVQLEDRQVTSMAQAAEEFRISAEMRLAGNGSNAEKIPIPDPVPDAVAVVPVVEPITAPVPRSVAQDQEKKPAMPARKRAPSSKRLSYRGVLIDSGVARRTQGNNSYNQYRVLLHDDNLGGEMPLWGTDLERVVNESGVKPGDQIEVAIVGETEVMIRGEPKPKTIWAISKV